MKIAQIAPPWLPVPPTGYGGIEWVVALLADGLVDRGHDVTLYASAGSRTRARLVSAFDEAPGTRLIGSAYHETFHAFRAYLDAGSFDLIHDHSGMIGLAMGALTGRTIVHTLHGPFTELAKRWYREISGRVQFVAISESQRSGCPDLSYAGTVHNGIDCSLYPFRSEKEDFLVFLGRANHEKGPEVAVEVAKRLGMPLVMVVKRAEDHEIRYWSEVVEPRLTGAERLHAEVSHDEKVDLLGRARAVLFPIQWEEPFGLVMTETMACGTPVIAFARGSAPEVIVDGKTGFLVEDFDAMCEAVGRVGEIDPRECRRHVEERFSAEVMVRAYEEIFSRVLARG